MANNKAMLPPLEPVSPHDQLRKWKEFLKRAECNGYAEPVGSLQWDPRLEDGLAKAAKGLNSAYTPDALGETSTSPPQVIVMAVLPFTAEADSAYDPKLRLIPDIDTVAKSRFILKGYPYCSPLRAVYPPEEMFYMNPVYIRLLPSFMGFADNEKGKAPVIGDIVKISYNPNSYLYGQYVGPTDVSVLSLLSSPENRARRSTVTEFKSPKPKYEIGPNGDLLLTTEGPPGPTQT